MGIDLIVHFLFVNSKPNAAKMISVLILTKNEEACIAKCLNSVSWSDDIHVLDSYSTDQTENIATSFNNVSFHKRRFDNFSGQRNFGLTSIPYKYEWVFLIDADEICTESLYKEMIGAIRQTTEEVAVFFMRRKLIYKDKWIKHNYTHPSWIGRLVKPHHITYKGTVHEEVIPFGQRRYLNEYFLHFPFGKGLDHWLGRRDNYANLMAEKEMQNYYVLDIKNLFSRNPDLRRKSLNTLYRIFPLRWLVFLLYNFFVRMCFLDGYKGMEYILLETKYEYHLCKQLKERKNESYKLSRPVGV